MSGMKEYTGEVEYLDDEERELAESIDSGEWEPVGNLAEAKERAMRYAITTLQRLTPASPIASPDGTLNWEAFAESVRKLAPERYRPPTDYLIKSA